MNCRKRLLAILLTLCMVIPMCLARVEAEGTASITAYTEGEPYIQNLVTISEHYRAHVGVNPDNGHDLVYIMFKGKDMIVYDIDAREIVDIEENTINEQQKGSCIAPNGNLWICGAGDEIYKYDPTTTDITKFEMACTTLGVSKSQESYGITYGDDGYLYFGYDGCLMRLNPNTKEFENLSGSLSEDIRFVGHGGVVYNNGYLYAAIYGDANSDSKVTSELIKFDIVKREVVQRIDILNATKAGSTQYKYGIRDLNLMDGILYGTQAFQPDSPLYVDITGDEMTRLNNVNGQTPILTNRFVGPTSDGLYYMAGYYEGSKCLYKYDPEAKTFTALPDANFSSMNTHGGVVTLGDHEALVNVVSNTATGKIDLYFYDLVDEEKQIWGGVSGEYGAATRLEDIALDPTGRYIFGGGYGTSSLGVYDTQTGESKQYPTMDHQIDSMLWYDGYLWLGIYENAHIVRFDNETHEAVKISALYDTVFRQRRMLNPTAGDGKVFFAGEPDAYMYGGVLAWYDIENERTYVAAGPEKKDVYYANTASEPVVWYNAETNGIADLDAGDVWVENEDGTKTQRFTGVVENQVACSLNYVDGYIIGATTTQNGKSIAAYGNPQLFAYDVNAMKLVATHDITETLQDFEFDGVAGLVDAFRADPYQKGKFWGVVGNTLFSATYNFDTDTFNVKEEVCFDSNADYQYHKSHIAIDIEFDGDYMYVCTQSAGTYMVLTSAPTTYYQLTTYSISDLKRMPDGSLIYLTKRETGSEMDDVRILRCADQTQPLIAASVQTVINALDGTDMEATKLARAMYNDLTDTAKDQVDISKLEEAEKGFAVTVSNGDGLVYYRDITDALNAATEGSTVTLLGDVVTETNLVVEGITLNLNGFTLTAASVFGVNGSQVVDTSTNAAGLLKADFVELSTNNSQIPLYDAEQTGYRLFTASVQALGVREGNSDDAKFWFRIESKNKDAYSLLAAGNSKATVQGTLWVSENKDDCLSFKFQNSTVEEYGQLEVNAQEPQIAGMYLNVKSVSKAVGDQITLIPQLECAGVTLTVDDQEKMTLEMMRLDQGAGFWG